MNRRFTFAETETMTRTTLQAHAGVPRFALALLFIFAITLLGVGKGWAQCTPNGQAGSTLHYNNCGGVECHL